MEPRSLAELADSVLLQLPDCGYDIAAVARLQANAVARLQANVVHVVRSLTVSSKASVHLLSTDERQRVIDALHFDPDAGNIVSLVERLQTSPELHQFVLSYNSNDGLLPLRAIIRMSACDLGTALCVYWLLGDFVMDRESYSDETDPDWDGVGVIEEIETRITTGFYTNQNIRFVPLDFLDWSPSELKRMKLQPRGSLPFPETMLEPSPGDDVPQEPLV